MKGTVKKRTFVLIVSYLAAAAIALGVLYFCSLARERRCETLVSAGYQHAFSELASALGEMDTALQKSVYAVSPGMTAAVCAELFGKAMMAQLSLGALPVHPAELEKTSGFISRVGDYAFALSREAAAGRGYTDEERGNLRALSETAGVLAANIRALQTELDGGVITLGDIERNAAQLDAAADGSGAGSFSGGLRLIEQEFPETPSLVYDGPFSEHIKTASPRFLEGLGEVSENQARRAAAAFTGISEGRLCLTGESAGEMPCYWFSVEVGGGTVSAGVTKTGGVVTNLLSSRIPAERTISAADAERAAIRFLESRGFEGMAETYRIEQGGVITINFAYKQDGVLCYSDLVKVSVAGDTGAVCGYEAMGYIMSHCRRELPEPSVTAAQARESVPEGLTLLSEQPALVPSGGRYERLCWELKCSGEDERHCLIYVNAETGEQEKILLLLEDETGTLAI